MPTQSPTRKIAMNEDPLEGIPFNSVHVDQNGQVVTPDGEVMHIVTAMFTHTVVLQAGPSPEERYFYQGLQLFFGDGSPPANILINAPHSVMLMGDLVKTLKTMFGIMEGKDVELTVPDMSELPPAPEEGDYQGDWTREVPPPDEEDFHG